MLIHNAKLTGSMHLNGMDMSTLTGSVSSTAFNQYTSSTNEFTGSANTSITNLNNASGSFSTRVTSLESFSSSLDATFATDAQLTSLSGSVAGRLTSNESNISSLNSRTGSYATVSGPNTFNGTQTVTGSLFITENLTVLGSSSISYISQSTLNIGTNLITVNAQNPTTRFGGLAVIDSGSAPQVSGSWLFDSIQNRWIMIHEQAAGAAITSSIALMGPETYNNLGNETTITLNRLIKGSAGASGEHVGDSQISDDGTTVSIPGRLVVTGSITGSLNGSNITNSSISNAKLANSSVTVTAGTGLSGGGSVALGSSITLTNTGVTSNVAGTGISISGTTGAVTITNTGLLGTTAGTGISISTSSQNATITNTGVTSITAGSGISISGATGGVTITNTITNNNQLTNGAGYITGINSTMVTNALGYTPYNSSNPSGYITGINSSMVTTALGYTPVQPNGTGASGTWGISISGNAATATNSTQLGGADSSRFVLGGSGARRGVNQISNWNQGDFPDVAFLSSESSSTNAPSGDFTYGLQYAFHRSGAAYRTQIVTSLYSDLTISIRNSRDSDVWTAWKVLLHSGNFNSYSPTLTGGGASGTWGINVTGTAGSLSNMNISQFTNNSGYITSSALSSYLPLSGGTMSGDILFPNNSSVALRNADGSAGFRPDDQWGNIYTWNTTGGYYVDATAYFLRSASSSNWLTISSGDVIATTSLRAPIFYDSNNTSYYLDPAGWSNLRALHIEGGYTQAGIVIPDPGANFGNGRAFLRIHPTSSGARIISFKMTISSTWNWTAAFGFISADVSFYFDGSSLFGASTTITSATGLAQGSLNIGQPTIEGGFVSVPVFITNSNPVFIKLEGSPSFDWASVTHSGWSSVGFPGSAVVSVPGAMTVGGILTASTDTRSPIFYDSNNTGFYLDPASTSVLNTVNISGVINQTGPGRTTTVSTSNYDSKIGSSDLYLYTKSITGGNFPIAIQLLRDSDGAALWPIALQPVGGNVSVGTYSDLGHRFGVNGVSFASSDMRSPIFYDSNNTGFYLDPASGFVLNGGTLTTRTYLHQSGGGGGQNLFTGVDGPTTANGRAQFIMASAYSDLVIASSQANNNHGSTLSFTAYNPSNAGDYRKFVINQGNWGSRMGFLDFGYADASRTNPHDYINATDDVLTLDGINKRVGINIMNPDFAVDAAGTIRASSDVRAPIFFDSNNTAFFGDFASRSMMNQIEVSRNGAYSGYTNADLIVGSGNADRRGFGATGGSSIMLRSSSKSTITALDEENNLGQIAYENLVWTIGEDIGWGVQTIVFPGIARSSTDMRAPIFYDQNNTGYFIDPGGDSGVRAAYFNGNLWINPRPEGYGEGVTFNMPNQNTWGGLRWYRNGPGGGFAGNWAFGYFGNESNNDIGFHNGSNGWRLDHSFNMTSIGSVRAPIFFDSNDTGFYLDPNGGSNLNDCTANQYYVNGWFRNNTNNTGLYSQSTTMHWSSKDNGFWDASSTTTVSSIRFFTGGHIADLRGYVFANTSNEIGFLNQVGSWILRCVSTSDTYLTGNFIATGNITANSDARLKENISTIHNGLEKVMQMRGVYFNRVDDDSKKRKIGVVAQEIQQVLPEVVLDGDMLSVDYGNIVGVLIEAIKEQQLQIEELKSKLDTFTN